MICNLASRALYLAALFIDGEKKCIACSILCPILLIKTIPAPLAFLDGDPSKCIVQLSSRLFSDLGVSSETKSASAYPFIALASVNLTSNLLGLISDFVRHPNISGFLSACNTRYLVGIVIVFLEVRAQSACRCNNHEC